MLSRNDEVWSIFFFFKSFLLLSHHSSLERLPRCVTYLPHQILLPVFRCSKRNHFVLVAKALVNCFLAHSLVNCFFASLSCCCLEKRNEVSSDAKKEVTS